MKVLFLTGEYPPLQGGIADYTANLSHALIPLGVEPAVLTTRRWLDIQLSSPNAPSSLLPPSNLLARQSSNPPTLQPSSPPVLQSSTFQPSSLPIFQPSIHPILPNWGHRCWPAIVKFLGQHRPQILHIQYQAANFDLGGWVNWLPWYLRQRGLPVKIVTTFHDLRLPYIFPKAGRFRHRSMLALARHSHAIICTNREDSLAINNEQLTISNEQLVMNNEQTSHLQPPISTAPPFPPSTFQSSTPPLLPPSTFQSSNPPPLHPSTLPPFHPSNPPLLTTIPLGTNIEPQPPAGFERSTWRARFGLTPETFLLAYFGFLNESKGGEELIEALAVLRRGGLDAHLLLIGGEVGQADPTNIAYAQKVQSLIEQYGLIDVVHRTGYVEQPEVSASLLAAEAVVMPYRDGVSFRRTTLIAALRHGCAIVTTTPADPRLSPEIKPGENMLLVPPRQAPALAQAITALAENPALRQQIAQGARQLSELFNWDQIAGQTLKVYQALTQT